MPRINIEQELWDDPRFDRLVLKISSKALAIGWLVLAWKISQQFWGRGRKLVPHSVFMRLEGAQELIDHDFAHVDGDFVYVRGTRQYHEWYAERVDAAHKGGTAFSESLKNSQAKSRANEAKLRPSSSSSSSKNKIHLSPSAPSPVDEFVELWNIWSKDSGLVACHGLSKKRAEAIRARLKENPDRSYWDSVMRIMANSKFLTGQLPPSGGRDKPFRADIDFLLRPDTHLRVVEGKYGTISESQPKKVILYDPELGPVESKQ